MWRVGCHELAWEKVVKTSVTVNNNSPVHDYVQLDVHAQPTN